MFYGQFKMLFQNCHFVHCGFRMHKYAFVSCYACHTHCFKACDSPFPDINAKRFLNQSNYFIREVRIHKRCIVVRKNKVAGRVHLCIVEADGVKLLQVVRPEKRLDIGREHGRRRRRSSCPSR